MVGFAKQEILRFTMFPAMKLGSCDSSTVAHRQLVQYVLLRMTHRIINWIEYMLACSVYSPVENTYCIYLRDNNL